jgi:hypothetical protein
MAGTFGGGLRRRDFDLSRYPRLQADLILDAPQLREAREKVVRKVLKAGVDSIRSTVREIEKDLEAATREAVPGRLWRAWASETFPKGGKLAREPVGTVFVKGGDRSTGAMTFNTKQGRIRGKDTQWLAIPTPAAGSRGRQRMLTPGDWERITGVRLRFVYRKGKPGLLVAEGTTNGRSGQFRKITRKRTKADERRGFVRGQQTVVIFVLVPFVDFANRVAIDPIVARAAARLTQDFVRRVESQSSGA